MKVPFITDYCRGEELEVWLKIAFASSYKKINSVLSNEELSRAVINYIYIANNDDITSLDFTEKNIDLIKEKASEIILGDEEFKEVIGQTLIVLLGHCKGCDDKKRFDAILNSDIYKLCFKNSYELNNYVKIVETFANKYK